MYQNGNLLFDLKFKQNILPHDRGLQQEKLHQHFVLTNGKWRFIHLKQACKRFPDL